VWVALFGGATVHRYRPDGTFERAVPVPARQPTSVCLIGSTLVVTSGRGGLDDPGPEDGAVLIADAGATGLEALPVRLEPQLFGRTAAETAPPGTRRAGASRILAR
jgi:hypothetical protein